MPTPPGPPGQKPPPQPASFWTVMGYYVVLYLIFLVFVLVGCLPQVQEYIKPVAKLIFPIKENSTWWYNVLVMSGMYWGAVLVMMLFSRKKA
jgi:hypothetical protein